MDELNAGRRSWLKTATALAATGLASGTGCAQTGGGSGVAGGLPGRGEYLIRGATILSMDARVGDFVRGDVHVRDGAIVGVARDIAAPSARAAAAARASASVFASSCRAAGRSRQAARSAVSRARLPGISDWLRQRRRARQAEPGKRELRIEVRKRRAVLRWPSTHPDPPVHWVLGQASEWRSRGTRGRGITPPTTLLSGPFLGVIYRAKGSKVAPREGPRPPAPQADTAGGRRDGAHLAESLRRGARARALPWRQQDARKS